MSRLRRFVNIILPPPAPVEESVPLRIVTTGVVLLGIWASTLYMENGFTLALEATLLTLAGSYFSWSRRYESNAWVKVFLFFAMIFLLISYFRELLLNPFDTRAPLAGLLIWLQVLHSFDLPSRRDLNYSLVVGLILMGVAGSISRTMEYALFFVPFIVLGYLAVFLEHRSAQNQPVLSTKALLELPGFKMQSLAVGSFLILLFSLGIYLLLPHEESPRIRSLPVSFKIDFPRDYQGKVINPAYEAAQAAGPEAGKSLLVNPNAYFGFTTRVDLNYRGRLSKEIVMRVRSPESRYWRGMAFDRYDGSSWEMSEPEETTVLETGMLPIRVPREFNSNFFLPFHELIQTFYIEKDSSNLIMASQNPFEIYFPTYSVHLDNYGGFRSPIPLTEGIVYSVVSWVPEFDPIILRKAKGRYPDEIRQTYLQLPSKVPQRVKDLALEITKGATNDYDRVSLIESYLKTNFVYDLEVPPTPAGQDVADWFLFDSKRGYCEAFTTAMAVMCRSLGIPARFTTGFVPGKRNQVTGYLEVRSEDAHAWVEVYFPRYGWVPFEATSSFGVPSEFTKPTSWSWGEKLFKWAHLEVGGLAAIQQFYALWDQFNSAWRTGFQNLMDWLAKDLLRTLVGTALAILGTLVVFYGVQQGVRWLLKRRKIKQILRRYPYLTQDGLLAIESLSRISVLYSKKGTLLLTPRELMRELMGKEPEKISAALAAIEKALYQGETLTPWERKLLQEEFFSRS